MLDGGKGGGGLVDEEKIFVGCLVVLVISQIGRGRALREVRLKSRT